MDKKFSFFNLFWSFFKIGSFTFGGGFAMIPLIEREILAKKWIDKKDLTDMVAISQSLPGAVAINMSLLVGYRISKKLGALVAVLGCILPSFLVILTVAMVFENFQDYKIVQNAFMGVRASIVALIIIAGIRLGKDAIYDIWTLVISIITVILLTFLPFEINPIYIILSGILVGILFYYVYPTKVKQVENRGKNK